MQANYSAGKPMKLMGGALQLTVPTTRQLKKAFHNFVLTVICGFTTILVLKGTTGFDAAPPIKVKNPASWTSINLRSELQHARLLSEVNNLIHMQHSQSTQLKPHLPQNDPLPNSDLIVSDSIQFSPPLKSLSNPLPHSVNHPLNPTLNPNPSFGNLREKKLRSSEGVYVNTIDYSKDFPGANSLSPFINRDPASSTDYQALEDLNVVNPTVNPESGSNSNPKLISDSLDQNSDQNNDAATRGLADVSIPVISNHDEQINLQNIGGSKHSILLVTGSQPSACDNRMGDHYLSKSLKNKMDYCRLHNIEIFYNMANFDLEMSGFWAKLPLLQRLMRAHPEKEWLWWMDSDAMITDMAFELPMDRYKDHNIILHGWKELVYEQKNWIGLNTGSFLIRNCPWSLDLLRAWAPMGPKGKVRDEAGKLLSRALAGRPAFEADDQSALIYLLNEERSKWGSKVYLENSYYLHGYWLILVDKYEEMMERYHPGYGDERWPFVTHFVGCKPCTNIINKINIKGEDKCLEHMERAFNFADNQVLQHYGLQHESLNTHHLVNFSPH